MKYGKLRPQGKVLDHWQLLHESDFEDTDTKLLLHLDNNVTDYATGKTVTNNNVTFSATTWKFTSHSGTFNGSNAYLSVPDSTDWNFWDGNFTVDCWLNLSSVSSLQEIITQYVDTNNRYELYIASSKFFISIYNGGVEKAFVYTPSACPVSANTWFHLAFVRSGNTAYIFVDGVSQAVYNQNAFSAAIGDLAAALEIGRRGGGDGVGYVGGYIDEVRIVKGTVKWTSNFTLPTAPYLGRTTTYPITKDRNNVLMISGEGADASTSVIDECGKVVTVNGGAQIDTAQFKFGQSSILFDGSGDYLTLADSADWDFGSGDFTIDFWVRFNSFQASGYQMLVTRWTAAKISWIVLHYNTISDRWLHFGYSTNGSSGSYFNWNWDPALNTWYHVTIVRNGNDCKGFVNGVQVGSTGDLSGVTMFSTDTGIYIGQSTDLTSGFELNGWLDDIRISKGIARWTSAFTPPLKTTALINGDTDEEYKLVSEIYSMASANFRVELNNDTGTNYGTQDIIGIASAITAARATSQQGMYLNYNSVAANELLLSDMIIYAKSGYVRTAVTQSSDKITGTTVGECYAKGHSWNNSTAPIASIDVSEYSSTNAIGCGTKFILYRKVI